MRSIVVSLIIAASALAADCGRCQGNRVVGSVPVFHPCPSCEGRGTVPDGDTTGSFSAKEHDKVTDSARPGRARPAVCRVVSHVGAQIEAGSGVLVRVSGSSAVVLTAYHVVRANRGTLEVAFPCGTVGPARLVAYDQDWDLAALATPRPEAEPVAIAAQAPRLGDRLTIAGYGPAGVYRELTGAVMEYGSPTKTHPAQFVDMVGAARQGDSGGPMFTAGGELAGILFGQARGRTVGSCSTRLTLFLQEADAKTPDRMLCEARP
jgi:S1-C subfamily serine protease